MHIETQEEQNKPENFKMAKKKKSVFSFLRMSFYHS